MTESSHNSIVLHKHNEARFNQLFSNHAKSQTNALKLSQYMSFVLDRSLVNNRVTLLHFYKLFCEIVAKRYEKQANQNANPLFQRVIVKQEFVVLLNELGKKIYHNDKAYQDRLYNQLLGQKLNRVMVMDQINRKMFMENAVSALTNFEEEMKNLYLIYVQENYWSLKRKNRMLLTHRQVELQNKKMSAVSFVRFLKESEIVPHLINIEHVEEILSSKVLPSNGGKQSEFYYKHFLVDVYSKDMDNSEIRHEGDPGLLLFQFMVAIARIAVQINKEIDNTKKVYDYVINKFFSSTLYLRTNQQINGKKKLPNANKSHLEKLRRYYAITQEEDDDEGQEEDEGSNPIEIMARKQQALANLKPLQFNVGAMLKVLENQLPPLPQQFQVKQEMPPPYPAKFKDWEKVVIGQQPPPEKADKKGNQKPPPKKNTLKKGQKPPRVFQFMKAQEQAKHVGSSEEYFQKLATELDYSLKPLSSLQRGNIPLDPFPALIAEILYPPQIPQSVLPYIQAGLNSHNENKFALAIENYMKAHQTWKEELNVPELSPSLQLFFQFTKGSVFLSAGKDDYALHSFYSCRNFQKIPYLSPDRALPYCGIGQVLYNAEQYQLSARSFLKARQIRESLLGIECVDTATVFNNLGCCFFMLDRNKEALSYFKVASAVLIAQLGEFHQRSLTAKQNENLSNKSFYINIPQYRKLWQVYEADKFGKKKKKKKDAKKK